MSNLSRILLIGLLAMFWVWGVFFASIQQQDDLARSAQSAALNAPGHIRSGAQQFGALVRQLVE